MITSSPLLADQRQHRIRAQLNEHGAVRTADLAAKLNVSSVTIRRDLVELQRHGVAIPIHGGARLAGGRVPPYDRRERSAVEVEAKGAIARVAAQQIQPGDVVYLDSGTTCAAMVATLSGMRDLTVVTSDLSTAIDLVSAAPHLSVVMAGGVVDSKTFSAVGEPLSGVMMNFVFDTVFVSASAWDLAVGATTGGMAYASTKRIVLTRAKKTVLLVDASKYGAAAAHVVRPLQEFDAVISDAAMPPTHRHALKAANVNLLIAQY